ncbi:MAG: hypothetical protein LH469_02130 [Frankiaceae bacterium]|nr:hypothetical protein [Frankiaceae bacterium]
MSSGQAPSYGYGYGAPAPKTETKAVVAVVLAVLAWTPTVPFIGAIAALFVARAARRDIEASGGALTGLSMCTWAVVLSWVHLAFLALLLPVLFLLFLLPFSFS